MNLYLTLYNMSVVINRTFTHVGLPEGEMETQTVAGWNESLDKLVESLN